MICAKKIYEYIDGITIGMLYDAYQRKFLSNDDDLFQKLRDDIKTDSESDAEFFANFIMEKEHNGQQKNIMYILLPGISDKTSKTRIYKN